MIYQPPSGARDLLPLDVAQKRWIEDRLEQVFHRWGYHRIITSTVEHLDTLMAGGAIDQSAVIELQDTQGQRLGLRPELTASIARAAVTRLAAVTYPQRLYYNANVFQRTAQGSHGGQQEYYQAGVELLGASGVIANAEILQLLSDCLTSLGLGSWRLILGDAGLTHSLLSVFPDALRDKVRRAIAHLDRVALETLSMSEELKQRALFLMDLRGRPSDVLQQVSSLDLSSSQRDSVNDLKTLMELLQETASASTHSAGAIPALILDLSLIRTFDYYTGLVFELVSDTDQGSRVLGQGGRYDNLLGLYHPQGQTYPGIGFILNIEELHQALLPGGQLPDQTPASDWLVAPMTDQAAPAAFAYAQKIRESANLVRVEISLDDAHNQEQIRDIARLRKINRIAWIHADGLPEIEALN
ncbi:MAG: ATP phosphoribosyltransferase regulatory subunit [Leptolyngbyaceae cyanobacterium MO_188.B28]|nr:ATP phosphoribosyltransferase regulatory subunit [Leptolyngbyaceae cyanobacterium MO_188.B28]